MDWKFCHLPKTQEYFVLTEPRRVLLINSNRCPKQSVRPCLDAGLSCCLGTDKICRSNECANLSYNIVAGYAKMLNRRTGNGWTHKEAR